MQEVLKDNHILTINDVAAILRCSKTHVSHVLAGKIPGIPRLTHIAMGRFILWCTASIGQEMERCSWQSSPRLVIVKLSRKKC